MAKHILLLSTIIVLLGKLESLKYNHILPNGGQIWAFLVAGSEGYINYRHQADVCHAYQVLHENGIPDSNIIVMMVDDIAYHEKNPTPGIILNKPNGTNVYEGVPKDYIGEEVNVKNFINVLTGNKKAMQCIGSGRVINSGPKDHIFLYFVDHGAKGVLIFKNDVLLAADFHKSLKKMVAEHRFKKMVIYVEACFSGSMFDNLLPFDLNIFVTTAADPNENSYSTFYDEKREIFLGDLFSVMWMDDAENVNLSTETLHNQFQRVRSATINSHVGEYGNLDIGNTKLNEIMGKRPTIALRSGKIEDRIKITDAVPSEHVPMAVLSKLLLKAKTKEQKDKLHLQLQKLIKNRMKVDNIVLELLQGIVFDSKLLNRVLNLPIKLTEKNMYCHKRLITHLSSKCFDIPKNPYALHHMQKFISLCSLPSFNESTAISTINEVCKNIQARLEGIV